MSCNIFNDASSNNGIGRADAAFSTESFAVTWQQFINADRASQFQTYMQIGGIEFPGTSDYLVAFDGNGGVSHNMAVGSDGSDTYGTVTPTIGAWVQMGFRRIKNAPNDYDNKFYYNLPTTTDVITKHDTTAVTLQADAVWYFGATTWTTAEGGDMKFRAVKIFTSVISEADLVAEAATSALAVPGNSGILYGRWPLVNDLLDVSGNARHFVTGVTMAFLGFAGSAGDYTFDALDPFYIPVVSGMDRSLFPKPKLRIPISIGR